MKKRLCLIWRFCFLLGTLMTKVSWAQVACGEVHAQTTFPVSQFVSDSTLGPNISLQHIMKPRQRRGLISLRRCGLSLKADEIAIGFSIMDSPEEPAMSHVFLLTPKARLDGNIMARPEVSQKDLIDPTVILIRISGLNPQDIQILNESILKQTRKGFSLPKLTCAHAVCSILRKGPSDKLPTQNVIYVNQLFKAALQFAQDPDHRGSVLIQRFSETPLIDYQTRFEFFDAFKKDEVLSTVKWFTGISTFFATTAIYHFLF